MGSGTGLRSPQAAGNQLGKLLGADHALVDLDVGHLVLGVEVDTGNVGVLAESSLHLLAALAARQRAGRDGHVRHALVC